MDGGRPRAGGGCGRRERGVRLPGARWRGVRSIAVALVCCCEFFADDRAVSHHLALSQSTKRFRPPAGGRATSLLLVQKRSSQEKTTPRWRALRASCPAGARAGSGVFRRHLRVPAKNWPASLPAILTDFPPPARRAIGTPGEAARSCAQKQRQLQQQEHPTPTLPCKQGRETAAVPRSAVHLSHLWERGGGEGLCSALLGFWRAGARLLFPGPLGGGEAGTKRPRSGRCHGGQHLFARAGARSKSPAPTHGLAGQDARQAPTGVAFLFGSFLFGHAKRKELGRRQAHETALLLAKSPAELCGEATHANERNREPRPLTSILSSLPRAAAIHGRSPRAPKGRGSECGRCAPAFALGQR